MQHNFASHHPALDRSRTHPRPALGMAIGAACRHYNVTPRALRFYDDAGLIETTRDAGNRRHLDAEACERLEWISRLRRSGVALRSIKVMFRFLPSGGTFRDIALGLLAERRNALMDDLRRLDSIIMDLEGEAERESLNRRAS